jgi:hypothetical protein
LNHFTVPFAMCAEPPSVRIEVAETCVTKKAAKIGSLRLRERQRLPNFLGIIP